jgi:hypothetical protein
MEPICFWAVFADDFKYGQDGIELINVHNQVTLIPLEPDQTGVKFHRMTLFVQVAADPGPHVLTFSHEGYEYVQPAEFEVPPGSAYLIGVERDFPVTFSDTPNSNIFRCNLMGFL